MLIRRSRWLRWMKPNQSLNDRPRLRPKLGFEARGNILPGSISGSSALMSAGDEMRSASAGVASVC